MRGREAGDGPEWEEAGQPLKVLLSVCLGRSKGGTALLACMYSRYIRERAQRWVKRDRGSSRKNRDAKNNHLSSVWGLRQQINTNSCGIHVCTWRLCGCTCRCSIRCRKGEDKRGGGEKKKED